MPPVHKTPPLTSSLEEDLSSRVERFEKTVALCLCIVPVIFSAQCLLVSLSAPVFSEMFADFGAKLPTPTRLVLSAWPMFALIAVSVPVTAVIIARRTDARFAIKFATLTGMAMFMIAQCVTVALFLPIFQLGAVAEG